MDLWQVRVSSNVSLTEGHLYPIAASGRSNLGHALETAVQNELGRRKVKTGYVKTGDGLEVDFLARGLAGGEELLQVCTDPSAPKTLDRELRALTAAGKEHPRALRRLLVLDRGQALRVKAPGVEVQPAYEWLLAEPAAA